MLYPIKNLIPTSIIPTSTKSIAIHEQIIYINPEIKEILKVSFKLISLYLRNTHRIIKDITKAILILKKDGFIIDS